MTQTRSPVCLRKQMQNCRQAHGLNICVRFAAALALLILVLASGAELRADSLNGKVTDPSGLAVAGARIEITGDAPGELVVLSSDGEGKFSAPNLKAGKYSVRVSKDGFEPLVARVEVHGAADLALK